MLNVAGGTSYDPERTRRSIFLIRSDRHTNFNKISVDGDLVRINLAQKHRDLQCSGNVEPLVRAVPKLKTTTTGVQINSFGKATLNSDGLHDELNTAIQSKLSTELDLYGLQDQRFDRILPSTTLDDSLLTLRNSIVETNGTTIGAGTSPRSGRCRRDVLICDLEQYHHGCERDCHSSIPHSRREFGASLAAAIEIEYD